MWSGDGMVAKEGCGINKDCTQYEAAGFTEGTQQKSSFSIAV